MIAAVTRRSTFAALSADGDRVRHGPVRCRTLNDHHPAVSPGPPLAVAFAFGRRFGSAVERNRAKRRLRSAIQDAGAHRCTGAMLVSGTRQILERPYPDLVDDVRHCLQPLVDAGAPESGRPAYLSDVKMTSKAGRRAGGLLGPS